MLKTFANISLIRVTVMTNSMICWLRSLPVTKHIFTGSLHKYEWIKLIIVIISWMREFMRIFVWKIVYYIYLFTMMNMIMGQYKETGAPFTDQELMMHFLVLLPVIGVVFNNEVFDIKEDTYHAIFTLKMPAREYMLSQFIYQTLKFLVGNLAVAGVALCVFGGLPFAVVFCYVFYGAALKWIYTGLEVRYRSRHIGDRSSNKTVTIVKAVITIVPLVFIIMPLAGISFILPVSEIVFTVLAVVTLLLAVPAGLFLVHFPKYRQIFKTLLNPEMIIKNREFTQNSGAKVLKESNSKAISGAGIKSDLADRRSGYDLFNALFFKRHRKIILMPVLVAAGIALLAVIGAVALLITEPDSSKTISSAIFEYPGFLLFGMYAINTGKKASEAMYLNCDSSMLKYRFYRNRKTLLSVFAGRLKMVVGINLIPAVVIAGGLALLIALTGGGEKMDIILLPVSIIMLSMFFSTHNIVLYYLLQPFTAESSIKNPYYKFVHMITYTVCLFVMLELKGIPASLFCMICSAVAAVYIPAALAAVYYLAPKTFRIRI